MKKIFIIAGESSGDYLAGRLMESIRCLCTDSIEFFGIGGPCMKKAGLRELFSINELSLIGIFEVLGKIFHLRRLINKTVDAVFAYSPDVVITIDSSGFTHRVDKKIKKRSQTSPPIIHYVAPPVWAWRGWRAKSMHKFIDKLLVLLPFETELFRRHGLETVFVGHPIATDADFEKPSEQPLKNFKKSQGLSSGNRSIVLLPGSRQSELDRHLPILEKFADLMEVNCSPVKFIMPTTESMKKKLEFSVVHWRTKPTVIADKSSKILAYYASDLAIAASGTVTLELARTGIPSIIIYKTSLITYAIVKFLIQVKRVCLINILAKQEVVPELLQNDCTGENIFQQAVTILKNPSKVAEQKKFFTEVMAQLTVDPDKAAIEVLKICP
ncbi:MAG: lipid-A-disaccharide synthase [Holosporaceae bacterium]|jgi:lipid-A-disaccharide synthase|nr:lipid-A-disaccharide synthase [Holosporaceae bacterium]